MARTKEQQIIDQLEIWQRFLLQIALNKISACQYCYMFKRKKDDTKLFECPISWVYVEQDTKRPCVNKEKRLKYVQDKINKLNEQFEKLTGKSYEVYCEPRINTDFRSGAGRVW